MEHNNPKTSHRFMRTREVCEKTGLSKSSIYEMMAQGSFPQTVRLSEAGRSVAFVESEIEDWMVSRVSARNVAV